MALTECYPTELKMTSIEEFSVTITATPNDNNSSSGRSARHLLGVFAVVAVGCVLFAASRKLVWGREESLSDLSLWTLAALPYAVYFGLSLSTSNRAVALLKSADFLAIWTFSLLAFVFLRATSLATIFEFGIYDSFGPGIVRYSLLSMIYFGLGYLAVALWRVTRPHLGKAIDIFATRAISLVAGAALFCCGVFLIAL
uniref:Uncharacterized protein n=1 Tax=Rhodopseudomonas palustris (strain BisA53) TaxID=316055 RepID=Q07PN8_RHOP5